MHGNEISYVKFPNLYLKKYWFTGNIHTRVQLVLIYNAKILSKKNCDATLGKPNRSFLAYSDNMLTLFIRRIETPFEWLR